MTALIDVDQLRTFIAIAETGSFTKAAEVVNKTQSAVSMQMKRLEERIDRPIFARDGRASKLTEDGQRLLDYARRIVKLNVETIAAFSDAELSGRVRLGVPDDYADRYLPEIMARFSRAYPGVELSVICEPSVDLLERIDANELDLAIITNCESKRAVGNLPPRAAAVGDVEPASDAYRGARCRSRSAGRAAAGGAPRSSGWRSIGRRLPPALFELERRRGRRRRARRPGGVGAAGIRPAARHARADGREGFPELPACNIGLVRNRARQLGARRRAGRAHHLVARQPVGGGAGGGVNLICRPRAGGDPYTVPSR